MRKTFFILQIVCAVFAVVCAAKGVWHWWLYLMLAILILGLWSTVHLVLEKVDNIEYMVIQKAIRENQIRNNTPETPSE
jgi:hypothetical protein